MYVYWKYFRPFVVVPVLFEIVSKFGVIQIYFIDTANNSIRYELHSVSVGAAVPF